MSEPELDVVSELKVVSELDVLFEVDVVVGRAVDTVEVTASVSSGRT